MVAATTDYGYKDAVSQLPFCENPWLQRTLVTGFNPWTLPRGFSQSGEIFRSAPLTGASHPGVPRCWGIGIPKLRLAAHFMVQDPALMVLSPGSQAQCRAL